jgi:recombination protein RecR
LLERSRDNGKHLANTLHQAMDNIRHCQNCRTFSETALCRLCISPSRDRTLLCIVESPVDMVAVEQMGSYRGLYFVLMGHLSPLDGIGPDDLGMKELTALLSQGNVKEVILATNPTVEGEATAHYISELIKPYALQVTRIAHGVPLGGELEYIDGGTLARAFAGRETV